MGQVGSPAYAERSLNISVGDRHLLSIIQLNIFFLGGYLTPNTKLTDLGWWQCRVRAGYPRVRLSCTHGQYIQGTCQALHHLL